jgi:hypothetical protein
MTEQTPTSDRDAELDLEIERRLRTAFSREDVPGPPASVYAEVSSLVRAPDVRTRASFDDWRLPGLIVVALALSAIVGWGLFGATSHAPTLLTEPSGSANHGAESSGACPVSPGTMHGTWWREIGGPNAFFNWEEAALPAQPNPWKMIVRFDPDAASQFVSVWADDLESGERVVGSFNGRMDPAGIYRFDSRAPDLPGGWYLFEQPLPTVGCWRLSAAIDGGVVGTAVIEVVATLSPTASSSPTAQPTPRVATTMPPATNDVLPLAGRNGVPGMLVCGNTPFSFEALDAPTGAEHGAGPEFSVLRSVAGNDPDAGGDLGSDPTFREVARDQDRVLFLHERADGTVLDGGRYIYVEVESTGVGWRLASYGDCVPRADWPVGYRQATWTLDPGFAAPDADTRTLHLLVHELACVGGKSASGRISPAFVTWDADELVIEIFVQTLPGEGDCVGNPLTPATLRLPIPFGDRTPFDPITFEQGGTGG